MLELLDSHQMQAFVLNTGRVGGRDDQPDSKKVTIPCSSAIEWAEDPEILQPRLLYARQAGWPSTTRW